MRIKIAKPLRHKLQKMMVKEGQKYLRLSYRAMRYGLESVYRFLSANTCPTIDEFTHLKNLMTIDTPAYRWLKKVIVTLNQLDKDTRQIVYCSWFHQAPKHWWVDSFSSAGYYRRRDKGMINYWRYKHRI